MDEKLKQAFASVFDLPAAHFSDSLSPDNVKRWDSLGHLELVAELQKQFGIEFKEVEIMRMESVAKIKEVLAERGLTS